MRCRLFSLTNSAIAYESKCEGGIAGSQPMSMAVHETHGAYMNFGDLTPYLTYAPVNKNQLTKLCKTTRKLNSTQLVWLHLFFIID